MKRRRVLAKLTHQRRQRPIQSLLPTRRGLLAPPTVPAPAHLPKFHLKSATKKDCLHTKSPLWGLTWLRLSKHLVKALGALQFGRFRDAWNRCSPGDAPLPGPHWGGRSPRTATVDSPTALRPPIARQNTLSSTADWWDGQDHQANTPFSHTPSATVAEPQSKKPRIPKDARLFLYQAKTGSLGCQH